MTAVYPWQQALWHELSAYLAQRRIPQALLISGAAGIGKRHLAEVFARALMCQTPSDDYQACGHCHSCTLFAAHTHPDYLVVEPDEPGKAIGIDKIRQLIVKLALKPQFDGHRVVLIQPADQLNIASANAFLKCLEEPTERTCLILLSEQPGRLPATIRSRCQKIPCRQPDRSLASNWLQQQGVAHDVDVLLALADGAPLLARRYAEHGVMALHETCFKQWLDIAHGKQPIVMVAEQWQKQDGVELGVVLNWITSWLSDIIKYRHDPELTHVRHPELKKSLQGLAERLELQTLYVHYDALLLAGSQLTTQVNKQLLLEQLLIAWSQLNSR